MSVVGSNVLAGASGQAGAASAPVYEIERSLRFDSSSSTYLSRTPSSAGNRKTWTWSAWVKKGDIISSGRQRLFSVRQSTTSNQTYIQFRSDNKLYVEGPGIIWLVNTDAIFTDPSAWGHVVVAFDTSQATASNRVRIYWNGVEQTLSGTFPTQNYADSHINNTLLHSIGNEGGAVAEFFNGYLAEIHHVDGQQLTASDFGELDSSGVWQPKEFTGSHNTAASGIVYSSGVSSPDGTIAGPPNDATALFDGGISTNCQTTTAGTTVRWTPPTTVSWSTSLRIYTGPYSGSVVVRSNGTDYTLNSNGTNVPSPYWVSHPNSSGTIDYIDAQGHIGAGVGYMKAIEVDGTILQDGTVAGVNGFYLKFADNSSSAALGTDSSGLSNTFTVNNLSVASGSGNDSLIDTPTNYQSGSGNNRGNYATWNPLQKYAAFTLSNGNLDFTDNNTVGGGDQGVHATIAPVSGKFYWEMTLSTLASENYIGISKSNKLTQTLWTGGGVDGYYYYNNGNKIGGGNGNGGQAYGASFGAGDVIGVAVDWDNGKVTFYKNGTSQGDAFTGKDLTGYVPAFYFNTNQSAAGVVNFGQRPFEYTPPTGYKSLCTANLSNPTIADGSTAMDVSTWTGTTANQSITGLNFSPDLVWIKARRPYALDHTLLDTVRGNTKSLASNTTAAESTVSYFNSFDSDGFTLNGGNQPVNGLNEKHVGWAWDAGTSTVTNTDGSITSNVRANPSAGFSIVGWTGISANGTIGHGLNAAPEFVIVKKRGGTGNWYCYHPGLTDATKYIWLNSTNAEATQTAAWNSTAPTSTVVHLGAEGEMNANGATSIAYCFAPVEGYSAFGSYTANGSADGPFVITGFRPRFLMLKSTSSGDWFIVDTKRDPFNRVEAHVYPNQSAQEVTGTPFIDILSNGFKYRFAGGGLNTSGHTIIYAAFAEHPQKTARAR